jgi:type VI secretion system protein ImpL
MLLFNEPGHFGLKKIIDAAKRKRKEDGVFELSWENGGITVSANLKIISAPTAEAQPGQGFRRMKLPPSIVGGTLPATPALATAGATP